MHAKFLILPSKIPRDPSRIFGVKSTPSAQCLEFTEPIWPSLPSNVRTAKCIYPKILVLLPKIHASVSLIFDTKTKPIGHGRVMTSPDLQHPLPQGRLRYSNRN
jgi:hypothetical protein